MKNKPKRPSPTKKTLKTLRLAIKFFGGNQGDLAKAIKVTDAMVSKWCCGKASVSLRCAILIEKKTKGAIKSAHLVPDLI